MVRWSWGKVLSALVMGIPPFMAYLLAPYVPLEWLAAGLCAVWIVAFDLWILIRVQNLEEAAGARADAPETVRRDEARGDQLLEKSRHEFLTGETILGPYPIDGGDGLRVRFDCAGEVKAEMFSADGHLVAATNPSSGAEKTAPSLAQGRYTVKVTPIPTRSFPTPKYVNIEVTHIVSRWHVHSGRIKA